MIDRTAFGLTNQPAAGEKYPSRKELLENVLHVLQFAKRIADLNQRSLDPAPSRCYQQNRARLQTSIRLTRKRIKHAA